MTETNRAPVIAALAVAACFIAGGAPARADSLQVLHWWQSASERKAVDLIAARLAEQDNIGWRDGMVPSGSGAAAAIVLRSRMLAKDAPEVAQVNGIVIRDWARLELLQNLDAVAQAGKWDKVLLPAVAEAIQSDGHVYAAPVGIHRMNNLFYNRKLLARTGLAAPATWDDFERVAAKLQQLGVTPLVQSSEPWQVAGLFETLVLSEGAAFYRSLFQQRDAAAYSDARLASALNRLRSLKKWMGPAIAERTWDAGVRELAEGRAAMMVMGDWAKGELMARGLAVDDGFGCATVPGTERYHLYNIDTLSMLVARNAHRGNQEKLAALIVTPALQNDYNQIKGSIPVLRNAPVAKMDACARASWKLFTSGPEAQVPSLVHRMATDETVRDAIVAEVHRYFLDDHVSVADAQRRLGAIARTYTKN
ncbi:ABC transporter substrate-binding protein [Pseudoduganella ginsengisoli]|uniref:Probable sugar-binding periplasmic protein n=1 Tax=Pseudoduganella ginsengisoli TaxID=1462440 RepID=A0A6L6PX53_9BURK|nr:ABC transporter substrate-binding protein [Pseudoduganella ginsengisoli]MTW02183.1 extracellular solute-binding protein [Pseudoduganella ginsengisoli]